MDLRDSCMFDRRNFFKVQGWLWLFPFFDSTSTKAFGAVDSIRPKKILAVGNHLGFYPGAFSPKEEGVDYVSSPTLRNIDKHRDSFTVFSHLDHDSAGGHGGVNAFLTGVPNRNLKGSLKKCFFGSDCCRTCGQCRSLPLNYHGNRGRY